MTEEDEVLEFYTNDEREILNERKKKGKKGKIYENDEQYIKDFLEETS